MTGHADVVPPGPYQAWSFDPYGGFSDGDRVWGRGAADMKGGLIAALDVFERFAGGPRDFPGQVLFIAVSGEEDSGLGTLSAIRRGYRAHAAILPEPTLVSGSVPAIGVAHPGAMAFQVTVPGRGAHAANRLAGENALDHYLDVHAALRADEQSVNGNEKHPLIKALGLPYPTNVGIIQGGRRSSMVMESLDFEVRFGVRMGETVDRAEARFRAILERVSGNNPWLRQNPPKATRIAGGFGPADTGVDHPLVSTLTETATAAFGQEPAVCAMPYGCDMASRWSVPCAWPTPSRRPRAACSRSRSSLWRKSASSFDGARYTLPYAPGSSSKQRDRRNSQGAVTSIRRPLTFLNGRRP